MAVCSRFVVTFSPLPVILARKSAAKMPTVSDSAAWWSPSAGMRFEGTVPFW